MDDIQSGEIWRADLSGLPRYSVVNVSQVLTLDRSSLPSTQALCRRACKSSVDGGLRFVLQL
jgi:hypothetical protein